MKIEDENKIESKIGTQISSRTLSQPQLQSQLQSQLQPQLQSQLQPETSGQSETHIQQSTDDYTERLLKDLNNFRKTQDLLMKIMNESLYSSRKFIYDKYSSFSNSYNDLYNNIIEGHENYNSTQINSKVNEPNNNEMMNVIKNLNEIKNKMTMNNLNKIKNVNI